MTQGQGKIKYTQQTMDNHSFDETLMMLGRVPWVFNGVGASRQLSTTLAIRCYNDGTYDYVCKAPPGTATSADDWQICRIDSSDNVEWADGDAEFDNIADNYASLDYS